MSMCESDDIDDERRNKLTSLSDLWCMGTTVNQSGQVSSDRDEVNDADEIKISRQGEYSNKCNDDPE